MVTIPFFLFTIPFEEQHAQESYVGKHGWASNDNFKASKSSTHIFFRNYCFFEQDYRGQISVKYLSRAKMSFLLFRDREKDADLIFKGHLTSDKIPRFEGEGLGWHSHQHQLAVDFQQVEEKRQIV